MSTLLDSIDRVPALTFDQFLLFVVLPMVCQCICLLVIFWRVR